MKRGEKYQVTDVRLLQGREAKRCEDPSGFGFSFAVSIKCLSLLGPTSALFSDLTSFQQFLCPRCPRLISLHAFVLLISFASPQNLCIEYSFLSFRFNLDITSSQIPSLIFQRQVMSTFPRNPPQQTGTITLFGCVFLFLQHLPLVQFNKFLSTLLRPLSFNIPGQRCFPGTGQTDALCSSLS